MTFRSHWRALAALAAGILVLISLATPAIALADSLTWDQTYLGPRDIWNNDPDKPITPVAARINGVSFFDASHGWAVGTWTDAPGQFSTPKYAFTAFTSDGGSTWTTATVQDPGVPELVAVAMPTADKVFATTTTGTIMARNGTSWVSRLLPSWPKTGSRTLRAISFTDADNGWAVGDLGGIARTINGGTSWTTVKLPATGGTTLYGIARVDASTCIAVGEGGALRRITAAGVTSIASPTSYTLRSVTFANASRGWAVGDYGTILTTFDGGTTWSAQVAPFPIAGYQPYQMRLLSVAFADESNGIAVGQYRQVWRTFDGGENWYAAEGTNEVPSSYSDIELRGAGFVPGDNAHPTVVGGAYQGQLSQSTDKARIYRGDWTGRVTPPPAAPTGLTVTAAGAPAIRVAWADRSSSEAGYAIERSQNSPGGPWTGVATTTANATSWTDSLTGTSADWTSTWYYRVRSFNGIGPSAWTGPVGLKLDTIAPMTASDTAIVYPSSATIHLAATDAGGSGVASTEWILDGTVTGTGSLVETSAIGPHTLQFRSTDVAGNVEAWRSAKFYVSEVTVPDSTPPLTKIVGSVYPYYTVPATILFAVSDGTGSGVFKTFVSVDGKPAVETTRVSVSTTGTHRITYRSIDYAGNFETTKTLSLTALVRPSSTGQPSRPVTPLTVARSKSFSTYGYVKRYSKTYSLRLYFYRYESGHWVYKMYDTTSQYRVSVPGDDFNKYKASTSLTKTGKWRVRARHVVGRKTIYSAYQYFTVK